MINSNDELLKHKLLNLLIDNPSFILLLKNKYIDDDVWKFCIEREPSLFKYMKTPSVEMCEFAVSIDGYNLKYIKNKFNYISITKKMAYLAIHNSARALFYVPKDIIDIGLMELAFDSDPSLMKEFDFNQLRYEYVRRVLNDNPSYIKYINNPAEELIISTIKKEPNVCVYFENISPRVREVIDELYPDLLSLYPHLN